MCISARKIILAQKRQMQLQLQLQLQHPWLELRRHQQQVLEQQLVQALEQQLELVLVQELLLSCRKRPERKQQPKLPKREICSFHYP